MSCFFFFFFLGLLKSRVAFSLTFFFIIISFIKNWNFHLGNVYISLLPIYHPMNEKIWKKITIHIAIQTLNQRKKTERVDNWIQKKYILYLLLRMLELELNKKKILIIIELVKMSELFMTFKKPFMLYPIRKKNSTL